MAAPLDGGGGAVFDAPQQAELYKLAEAKMVAAAEKSELRERVAEMPGQR